MQSARPIRLCVVVTVSDSLRLLYRARLEHLRQAGFEVTAVCAPSALDQQIRARGVRLFTIPMARAITPGSDLRSIWRLWRFFRREKFDLIEVSTPKAALVGAIAARLARAPRVIHVLRGLAYEHHPGFLGWILRLTTAIPCRLAHQTIAISPSLRERAGADGMGWRDRIIVLGAGSYNGVDVQHFSPARRYDTAAIRKELGIPEHGTILGFAGRLAQDKGVAELVHAFTEIRDERPDTWLVLLGEFDTRDRPPDDVVDFLRREPHVVRLDHQDDIAPFLAAMDIFVLPTYREGLGNVLIEAGAMGLPTITTHATGARDATKDGLTGIQVPVGDTAALRDALLRLIDDPPLRARMGAAGRAWVAEHFDQKRVWQHYDELYRRLAGVSAAAKTASRPAEGADLPPGGVDAKVIGPSPAGLPEGETSPVERRDAAR